MTATIADLTTAYADALAAAGRAHDDAEIARLGREADAALAGLAATAAADGTELAMKVLAYARETEAIGASAVTRQLLESIQADAELMAPELVLRFREVG